MLSGIKEIRAVMAEAEEARRRRGRRTILFVDEIHRFNKAQQDAFLPRVEAGDIVLIGATTENPSFEVNSALLSRSKVYVLKPLERRDGGRESCAGRSTIASAASARWTCRSNDGRADGDGEVRERRRARRAEPAGAGRRRGRRRSASTRR